MFQIGEYHIRSDFSIEFNDLTVENEFDHAGINQNNTQDFKEVSFDTGLKLREKEQRAKNSLKLPYTNAQSEKGSFTLFITLVTI